MTFFLKNHTIYLASITFFTNIGPLTTAQLSRIINTLQRMLIKY